MITLIIFLCFIVIALIFAVYKKIEIVFKIEVKNFDYNFEYKIMSKTNSNRGNVIEFFNSGEGGIDIEFIKDVSSMMEITKLKTDVRIGTEFIFLTNLVTIFFSTVIPMLYNFPFEAKKNLSFQVDATYDKFDFYFLTDGEIAITYYELFLIYIKAKLIKKKAVTKK